MRLIHLLVVVGVVQSIFLVGIVVLLLVNRRRSSWRRRQSAQVAALMRGPLQSWLLGEGPVSDVARVLSDVDPDVALDHAIIITTSRAAASQRGEFSAAIRGSGWVHRVLARATSRHWWRRLDAARLLAVVGSERDRTLLHRLLSDPHPAVQGVAAASLSRIADMDAVTSVLEGLPHRALAVRLYQFSMLRETWWLATPALLERLMPDAPPEQLDVWISLAEHIGTAELLERVCELAHNEHATVRIAVARALKRYFHPRSYETLLAYLDDPDWRVRAVAARSLGTLGDERAVNAVAAVIADAHWWVRFRAALALAQLGETGRRALRDARAGQDRYAAEMATMVSGLSPGSIVELSEG